MWPNSWNLTQIWKFDPSPENRPKIPKKTLSQLWNLTPLQYITAYFCDHFNSLLLHVNREKVALECFCCRVVLGFGEWNDGKKNYPIKKNQRRCPTKKIFNRFWSPHWCFNNPYIVDLKIYLLTEYIYNLYEKNIQITC